MPLDIAAELAPTGVLRVGVNLSNFLLVTGKAANGDPVGVSPDMGRAIADRIGVPVKYVTFPGPGQLADAVTQDLWDIGLIGAEPQRAETIAFTPAYCEIEATYLVPAGSAIKSMADIDAPGIRIAVSGRAAYGLWLERNIKHAELVRTDTIDSSTEAFTRDKLDVLAGLKPKLISDQEQIAGSRIIDGNFMTVQQAIGTPKKNTKAPAFLRDFVEEAKASGLVVQFIERHKVRGLSVAPRA